MKARFTRRIDLLLLFAVSALALIGALGVGQASVREQDAVLLKQLIWIGFGILLCLTLRQVNYHFFLNFAWVWYFLAIGFLLLTLFVGLEVHGNRSWLSLAGVSFQPSEGAKLAVILLLSRFINERVTERVTPYDVLISALIVLGPTLLILLQGDLGTALVYGAILVGMVVVGGLETRFLARLVLIGALLAPVGWFFLKDYQKERILVTLDAERDPQGVGYQTLQSQIAIGSGGLLGKGLGNGLQAQLGFVPEVHTDFIFSLLTEETGFLGATIILALYLLVLFRVLNIGAQARDRSGLLLAAGIASVLFFHVVINVGMTLGLLPSIGIPLPLLSYGGSSTLTTFAAIGLILGVHARRYGEP